MEIFLGIFFFAVGLAALIIWQQENIEDVDEEDNDLGL